MHQNVFAAPDPVGQLTALTAPDPVGQLTALT